MDFEKIEQALAKLDLSSNEAEKIMLAITAVEKSHSGEGVDIDSVTRQGKATGELQNALLFGIPGVTALGKEDIINRYNTVSEVMKPISSALSSRVLPNIRAKSTGPSSTLEPVNFSGLRELFARKFAPTQKGSVTK